MSIAQPFTGKFLPGQVELSNTIRRLWVDNNRWIRTLISRILFNIGGREGRESVEIRLAQIASDFGNLFAQYYGEEVGHNIRVNYLRYIDALELLIEAYRDNDLAAATTQRQILYGIADELAREYSKINKYWDMPTLQILLYELINDTENQIISILAGDYVKDIEEYDAFMEQAYRISDELTYGMLRQFQF